MEPKRLGAMRCGHQAWLRCGVGARGLGARGLRGPHVRRQPSLIMEESRRPPSSGFAVAGFLFSSKHKPQPGPGRLRLNSSRLLQLSRCESCEQMRYS